MTFANQDRRPVDEPPGAEIGRVIAVTGSRAGIGLLPHHDGAPRGAATVGRFVGLATERSMIVAMVTEATAEVPAGVRQQGFEASATLDLLGEIRTADDGTSRFRRGVSDYPAIGDAAVPLDARALRLVYSGEDASHGPIGRLHLDDRLEALVDVNGLVNRHFAVLGTTGVGKSSGMTVLLDRIMQQRDDVRIFLLDGHNEYGRCFGDRANVIDSRTLKLPFWLFNFEEMADVIFAGRPAVAEELEILADVIPAAKGMYSQYKSVERGLRRKIESRSSGYTGDMPVPYLVQDLLSLIDERMGRLENRAARMHFHRLGSRIEAIRNDPHYAFMFENANVGGDTMAELLTHLFRLDPQGKPISVMQLGGLPVETVDAVVCVLSRLAFDLGLWSDGAVPLLLVCEEAHRYASSDAATGFRPTRRALTRIAREGRKYGVFLGLVTQRPAELDPTIIAQCGTLFAMRMTNDRDQALLRSAVSDAAADLLDFVPTLGTGEAVAFGEGVPLPVRMSFTRMADERLPRNEAAGTLPGRKIDPTDVNFVRAVVERWRGQPAGGRVSTDEGDAAKAFGTPQAAGDGDEFRALRSRVEAAMGRKDPSVAV